MIARRLLVAAVLVAAPHVMAECVRPQVPEIADGTTADVEAMVKSQQDVKSYQAQAEVYRQCLQEQEIEDQEDGEISEEDKAARLAAYNGMVDEETALAESWNTEIREFKSRESSGQ